MASEISSNYFFHFAGKINYLLEILEHKAFSPRYICEDFEYIDSSLGVIRKIYILMKCFCDIPLNLMENHSKAYGPCGIALNKDWGIKNNLTPIHYIPVLSSNAWYQSNLSSLYSLAFSKKSDANIRELLTNYFIYTKPYQKKDTVFYDEREWRYIPSLENIKKINGEDLRIQHHFVLPNQNVNDLDDLNDDSNNLKNNEYSRLDFELSDIKYLIVEKDNEVEQIRKLVMGNNNIKIITVSNIVQ